MKDKNTGVQHVTGVLCTLAVLLFIFLYPLFCFSFILFHFDDFLVWHLFATRFESWESFGA